MKLYMVHNYYNQLGGEDIVFQMENSLLIRKGHHIDNFISSNNRFGNCIIFAIDNIWSFSSYCKIKKMVRENNPQVAHFHNIYYSISPAAYYACQIIDTSVVQTLHNFRSFCPSAILFRKDHICEECLGKMVPWPSIKYGCWRNSRLATAAVAAMLTTHNLLRTWQNQVDIYIALTEFARQKFIQGGLPEEKIVIKPNFVYPDPEKGEHKGKYSLFVGRISVEKGIATLLKAWHYTQSISLRILGEGPLFKSMQVQYSNSLAPISWLGARAHDEVLKCMQDATMLIFPSICFEGFPMTLIEAFACGTPVIASRLGAMAEIVEDGKTGLLFTPGDAEDLAAKVQWAWDHPKEMAEMGKNARREYEEKYTAERNYQMLMDIYQKAIENHKKR